MKIKFRASVLGCLWAFTVIIASFQGCSKVSPIKITLCCSENNDLYLTLKGNGISCSRYSYPEEAVNKAAPGSGVIILADKYPDEPVFVDSSVFRRSLEKKLKLYLEYPAFLPGITTGEPKQTSLERVVVTTDSLEGLYKMQILSLHNCYFIPVQVENPLLAAGRVAGFDCAVYGLEIADANPVLFRVPEYQMLVSATRLSNFISARYGPEKAIRALWDFILRHVSGDTTDMPDIKWIPNVRPAYSREEALPADAVKKAIRNGINWHTDAKMLLSEAGWEEYKKLWNLNDSNMLTTVPAVNNAAPIPLSEPGDGKYGLLEGIASEIHFDGSQPARWWLRSDSNGESSLAFALHGELENDERSRLIAGNLLDWLYFNSKLFQKDSLKSNYGLLFWAPGNAQALYQDNDVKAILGCIGTAGILKTDRWDEVLIKNILGNFRTTGINGFRGRRIENPDLLRMGWESYSKRDLILLQPHYEAWTWASYLWLYDKTHWEPLLEKTRKAIRTMMEAYPDGWRWTNGIQQERGRMLLPLAWLIRIEDSPEYRYWLKKLASDIEKCQDKSGAIREELGALDKGDYIPCRSNAEYGTNEAPLIQENGDPVSDLLYTCNFTFMGLNEAYAATGDEQYKKIADRLADFLVRIQVRSERHPEIDGGWFRAFDYNNWEYMGSNADSGWGAWSIESGWTQAWIPSVLAMRELRTSLWQISKNSGIIKKFDKILKQMIP